MLTRLGLRNFKAFGDEMQYAPFGRRITLIYGPNSGGKSSIIQALLMMKQSHEAHEAREATYGLDDETDASICLVANGNLVNLGSYSSLVHNHESKRNLEVDIAYESEGSDMFLQFLPELQLPQHRTKWSDVFAYSKYVDTEFSICGSIAMEFEHDPNSRTNELVKFGYEFTSSIGAEYRMGGVGEMRGVGEPPLFFHNILKLDKDSEKSLFRFIQSMRTFREGIPDEYQEHLEYVDEFIKSASRIDFNHNYANVDGNNRDDWHISTSYGIPLRITSRGAEGFIEFEEPYFYKHHLNNLIYLGPVMAPPERYYAMKERSNREHTVGVGGKNVPQILMTDSTRANDWLAKFDVPYNVNAAAVSGDSVVGSELVAIYLTHQCRGTEERQQVCEANHHKTPVTLADVGFGINQILPVIMQGVISPLGSIICVEQPEIHLHPRLQANIADFLIETSGDVIVQGLDDELGNEVKYSYGPHNRWIVETHSEMIIRRLQTRIREGKISYKDVSVLYVDPQDDGSSTIKQLRLDENGYWLDDWPDGFFDESVEEARSFRRARKVRN